MKKPLKKQNSSKDVYKVRIGMLEDLEYPPRQDIVAMVSCIGPETEGEVIREGKPFLGLNIYDNQPIHIWQFDKAIKFIGKYIKKGDVQVVCEGGSSRSVAIAVGYYLSIGMGYYDAIKKVGMGPPKCGIHRWSLLIYALKKGFINKDEIQKEVNILEKMGYKI